MILPVDRSTHDTSPILSVIDASLTMVMCVTPKLALKCVKKPASLFHEPKTLVHVSESLQIMPVCTDFLTWVVPGICICHHMS